jgi:hypothetical protein
MTNNQPVIGDRVVVSDLWFVEYLRGAAGTVTAPPADIPDQSDTGILWIEFDEPWPADDAQNRTDSAEIDAEFLIRQS